MPYLDTPSGSRIYYERYGQQGPALILLHGLASSSRIWFRQIRALRRHFRVYVIDFPGHGKSDKWQRYSFTEFAELLRIWMDHCDLQQAHIIGLSLGASVALTFAVRHPERIGRIILEGPVGGYHAWWNPLGWPDRVVLTVFPVLLHIAAQFLGRQKAVHRLNKIGVRSERGIRMLEAVQALADARAVRQLLWQSSCPPYVGHLDKIHQSVLMIRGKNDPMPLRFVAYIVKHLATATLVEVPEARHLVALETPRDFNRLVVDFLTQTHIRLPEGWHTSTAG